MCLTDLRLRHAPHHRKSFMLVQQLFATSAPIHVNFARKGRRTFKTPPPLMRLKLSSNNLNAIVHGVLWLASSVSVGNFSHLLDKQVDIRAHQE